LVDDAAPMSMTEVWYCYPGYHHCAARKEMSIVEHWDFDLDFVAD
jgi:hypothetical protein